MKFVHGKSHPLVEPDWFMLLCSDSLSHPSAEKTLELVEHNSSGPMQQELEHSIAAYAIRAKALIAMPDVLPSRNGWYVNRVGGMCPHLYDIDKEVESDDFPPLECDAIEMLKNTKFSMWPGGSHWYARLPDGRDVEIDGQSKWDSKEQSVSATKKFLCLE